MPKEQTITFISDGYQLVGSLHLPDRLPAPMVIGCHGLLANRHSPKQIALGRTCCEHGIGYLRFDHRGCGESPGDLAHSASLNARCDDLASAIAALAANPSCGSLLGLFGSSFGGTVVLSYSAANPVTRLVTYAAPITSNGLGSAGVSAKLDPGHKAIIEHQWDFDIRPSLSALANILIIHAENDAIVPVAHAHEIHCRAKHPKKLWIQNKGDHPMSDPILQTGFLSQALNWYQKGL